MLMKKLPILLLFILSAPTFAAVYKCNDGSSIRYSTTPCDSQVLDLEIYESPNDLPISHKEVFISPVYPSWPNGWIKSKDLKLERFSETEYEPAGDANNHSTINQQKLTNLPQSMTVYRFAVSVEDIIESICASALIYEPDINKKTSAQVFYGQYACSFRRDTKQGELGYYKIMRGEDSIYMTSVKWKVPPFEIDFDKPLLILDDSQQKKKITLAEQYLQNEVRLCRAGICL